MQILSIYHSIYVPNLTYDNKLCVVTKSMSSWIQLAEMSALTRLAGLSLRDKGKSSVIWGGLGVELLLLLTEMIMMPPG